MRKSLRVLIVEDSEEDYLTLLEELKQTQYELYSERVDTQVTLKNAMENKQWDLVLSDFEMPGFSGLVALTVVRKYDLNIPFIFVSRVMGETIAVKAMKMGATDYVMKGSLKRLIPAVERELMDASIRKKQKIAEEALHKSDRKWRELFEHIRDGWVSANLEGRFTECNQAFEQMVGYTLEELKELTFQQITPVKWHQVEQDIYVKKIVELGYSGVYEKEYIRKNGTVFPVELSAYVIMDDDGKPIGMWGLARDITERKKMENELKLTIEKAEESSRLKSSLLLNISHELRTPMNGILGFAQFLKEVQTDPDNIEMADNIVSSGKRLMATLNSILDLAALESNRTNIEIQEVKLCEIIGEVIANFRDVARKKGIRLVLDCSPDFMLQIDRNLFSNIIHHLVDNAFKFTKKGSVSVSVGTETQDGKNYAVIRVADTGMGISPKQMKFIFEPFRQGSEGLGRTHEGTGLGLTLCKKLTDLMQGEIFVESRPGEGSAFFLKFPASLEITANGKQPVQKSGKVPADAAGSKDSPARKPNVMIVEDNQINCDLFERYILDIACVDKVYDGFEAVKMARSRVYDAILMDINLSSEMDGISATREIRTMKGYDNVPIIAVTGFASLHEKEYIMANGLTHYIAKPFEKEKLRSILMMAIESRKA